jgi:hypothetical protein
MVVPTLQASQDSRFFFYYALALLAVVLLGFGPSFFARVLFESAPMPAHLHAHGAILTGWYLLLMLQATLIRSGRPLQHRKLGVVTAVYGAVVSVGALMATFRMVPRELSLGVRFDMDMAEVAPAKAANISYLEFASGIVWFNILSVVAFAVLLGLAVVYRRRGDFHKRFVLLASVAIVPPALARMSRLEFLGSEQGPFIPLCMLLLLLAMVANDYRQQRRVHIATVTGIGILLATTALAGFLALSEPGIAFVRSLA